MKAKMLSSVVWCVVVLSRAAADEAPGGPCGATETPRGAARPPASGVPGAGAGDALLEALAGARGRNRLAVCGAGAGRGRCPAALWRQRWALARAACVSGLSLGGMRVLRTTSLERTCDALEQEPALMSRRARRAVAGRLQPLWLAGGTRYDAALLELDRPFAEEPLANYTAAELCLQDIRYWMETIDEEYWNRGVVKKRTVIQHPSNTMYTLFMTGILPAAMVLVFFLFIIFGTGTPIQVPYSNEKDGIKTPWMTDEFSSDVKCFPTYGQV